MWPYYPRRLPIMTRANLSRWIVPLFIIWQLALPGAASAAKHDFVRQTVKNGNDVDADGLVLEFGSGPAGRGLVKLGSALNAPILKHNGKAVEGKVKEGNLVQMT